MSLLRENIETNNPDVPQLGMFDFGNTIQERFYKFHNENPEVYRLFDLFAKQLLKKGWDKIGAKMIMERIRWEYATQSKDDRGFKINNDFICHYSRLFMKNNPQHEGCFETRSLKTA